MLALVLTASLVSPLWVGLPWALVLCRVSARAAGLGVMAFRALCIGMVAAGALGSAICIVQVFALSWPDGEWVARPYIVGRASIASVVISLSSSASA